MLLTYLMFWGAAFLLNAWNYHCAKATVNKVARFALIVEGYLHLPQSSSQHLLTKPHVCTENKNLGRISYLHIMLNIDICYIIRIEKKLEFHFLFSVSLNERTCHLLTGAVVRFTRKFQVCVRGEVT